MKRLQNLFLFLNLIWLVCGDYTLVKVGDSFTYTCPLTASDSQFLQIYKTEVKFPHIGGSSSSPGTNPDGTELKWIISTNGQINPDMEASMSSRYTAQSAQVIQVTDAVVSDSGMWTCRVAFENTNSTQAAGGSLSSQENVTVISPVLQMRFLEADSEDINWRSNITYIDSQVTLNKEEPKRFGCQVWFEMGIPEISGFWVAADGTETQVDTSVWDVTSGLHSFFTFVEIFTVSANASGILWAETSDIPNVGKHNGTQFACRASLPLIGAKNITIDIQSTTPVEEDDDDDDKDPNSAPVTMTTLGLLGIWALAFMTPLIN